MEDMEKKEKPDLDEVVETRNRLTFEIEVSEIKKLLAIDDGKAQSLLIVVDADEQNTAAIAPLSPNGTFDLGFFVIAKRASVRESDKEL